MIAALLAVAVAVFVLAFTTARVWIWATRTDVHTPPPRDVRLWARIFARDLYPAMQREWPA